MTGRWVRRFSTGTADTSRAARAGVRPLRIPRSQRMTCVLPPDRIYSADSSSLLHRGGSAALEQDGLAGAAESFQQGEILHIARTHLQHVHISQRVQLGGIGDLGNGGQARITAGLHQQRRALLTQTLEGVGRGAGLEGASAEHDGPGGLYGGGDGLYLVRGLHGTGPGDQAEIRAHTDIAHRHHGILRMSAPGGQVIGRGQTAGLLHIGQGLKRGGV